MAEPLPTSPAGYVGDYTARHDRCLYRIGWNGSSLTLCRCCACGPDPAQDQFSAPYTITDEQARRLLVFSLDPFQP